MSLSLPQGVENSESMLGYLCQRSGGSSQNNKTVRSYCFNKSSSSANSDKFSTSSTSANESIESNSMLSSDCIRQQQFKGGTSVAEPNMQIFDGRYLKMDASKNCWGSLSIIPTEENEIHRNNNLI